MRTAAALLLTCVVICGGAAAQVQTPPDEVWRTFAQKIEPGARVRLQLRDGRRVTATLLDAQADGLLVQPRTRIPVPPQRVAYGDIVLMERDDRGGMGAGKAIAIGVASGVGAFLGTLLILIATLD